MRRVNQRACQIRHCRPRQDAPARPRRGRSVRFSSAQAFCAIASGIDDELQRNAIGHDKADEIAWLRGEIAQWEREAWRWADQTKAAAERFLLLATFAASSPSPAALQKAEQQVAMLNRRLTEVQAAVAPYRAGRKPGR